MDSRERVLQALHRKETDRPPFSVRPSPALAARLKEHLGTEDLETYLGQDIRWVPYLTDQQTADFSGYLGHLPAGATVSPWGCAAVQGSFMHFTRSLDAPMRALREKDLDAYPWPSFEPKLAEMRARVDGIHRAGFAAVSGYESGSYEQACDLRGREQFLMDLAGAPELAESLLTRISIVKARKAAANASSGVDVIWIGDDLGTQRSLVFSPQTWRRLVRPPLLRIITAIRGARKDVLIAYHSCGHVEPLVGELAEAGIDVLESVQPEANDPARIKMLHGARLSFWGGLGSQSTFSRGSTQDVRREVRERIATLGKGGGLMIAPAHVLEPEVPVENVLAFVGEVKRC
jgi:uroporphyrinogen decarboxylase